MKLADLKNIIPLGVLADGIYPSGYNSKENKYENFKDDEEDITSTYPAIYLYYRNNGHLYLYRSKEEIEIDLTNVTAYDYTALFKFSDKVDVLSMTIDDFQHVTLDSNCYTFSNTWVKPSQRYLYILVPIVRAIHSITIQGQICTNLFSLHEVWTHDDKCYWVYRTDLKGNFDFNDEANAILEVKAYVKEITADELAPTVDLLQQLNNHINNSDNPHNITAQQLGLSNVDNVPDIDKPVSNPQREFINETIVPFNQHVNDKNNPHNTTKAQIGLGNVDNVSDINKPISNPQKTFITEHTKSLFEHLLKRDNPHNVNKEQVGLSDVDNTADIDKPVSNPQKEFIKQYVKDQLKDIPSGGGGGGGEGITSSDHFKYYEFLSDYETAKENEEFVQPCIIYIEETDEVLYHMNKAQYMARFVWSSQFIEDMNTMGMPIVDMMGGIPLVFKTLPIISCTVNGVERINDFETINGVNVDTLFLKEIPNEGEVFEISIIVDDVIIDILQTEVSLFTFTPVEEIIINDDVIANFKPLGYQMAIQSGFDPSYNGFGFAMLLILLLTVNLKTLRLDITDASVLGTDINYLDIDYGWMFIEHLMLRQPITAHILTELKGIRPKLIIPADNPTYGSDNDPLEGSIINIKVMQNMLEAQDMNLFTLEYA